MLTSTTFPPMPIIVGSPRSGTTLLRFMLDSHPALAIPPETAFLAIGSQFVGQSDDLRKNFFEVITNFPETLPTWPDFEISNELFWEALKRVEPFDVANGYRTFYRLYAERFGKSRWGDKTPIYCLSIDGIRTVLPEARFVHIIRDGRDAALSLRRMWFSPGPEMETQAAYWRNCVTTARKAGLDCEDYLEVRYEDLVRNPPGPLTDICRFIGLEYDPAMLNYFTRAPMRLKEHKGRTNPDGTLLLSQEQRLDQQKRTMEPPDPGRVFAWKTEMTSEERSRFEEVAGDLLRELHYEV